MRQGDSDWPKSLVGKHERGRVRGLRSDRVDAFFFPTVLSMMDRSKKKEESPQMQPPRARRSMIDNLHNTDHNSDIQQSNGSWKQFKDNVQEKWGELTGDDMDRFEGKRERLEGYIQKQTGEAKQVIQKTLDALTKTGDYTF